MLHAIFDETGLQPSRAVMIGDTTHDLQLAENAGSAAIGVTYGAHEPAASKSAYIVDTGRFGCLRCAIFSKPTPDFQTLVEPMDQLPSQPGWERELVTKLAQMNLKEQRARRWSIFSVLSGCYWR